MAGTIIADTLTHSTAGSVTTDYVVNGSAKAWINFDGTSTGAVDERDRDSFNCAVTVDNGTGNFTIGFTSSMANANFAVGGITGGNALSPNTTTGAILCPQQTTSTFVIRTGSSSSDTDVDRELIFSNVHGDLA